MGRSFKVGRKLDANSQRFRLEVTENMVSGILPDSINSIQAEGTIVWVGEDRQGLHFTDLSIQAQDRIRNFVYQAGYR